MNGRIVVLLMALACAGCGYNRVALGPLPSRDAPLKERIKAYKAHEVQSGQQTTYLRNGVPQSTNLNFVLLGDGTRLEDARDLAPLVEPTSATGRYVDSIEASMRSAKVAAAVVGWSAVGSAAVGLGLGAPIMAGGDVTTGGIVMGIFGGLAYVLANIWIFPLIAANTGNQEDRVSAFMTFNKSLQERLGLDEDSLRDELQREPVRARPSARLVPSESFWLFAALR